MPSFMLPRDLADAFGARGGGPTLAVVRRDFAPAFDGLGLSSSPAPPPGGALTLGGGRGGAWTIEAPPLGDIVVRPGRRGGWPGRFIRSRYLAGNRFLDELVLTERLRRRGAPVPEPLAAVQRARKFGYETWIVTRRVEAQPLPAVLGAGDTTVDTREVGRSMEEAGRLVAAFHAAGGAHADLNANNLLIAGGGPAGGPSLVIDLDRGRMRDGPALPADRIADLRRLRRSMQNLGLAAGLAAWPAFDRGYASGVPPAVDAETV